MNAAEETERAAALAYIERARAEASVIPNLPNALPIRQVDTVGVIGAGTMGCGIAMAFAEAGFRVVLNDVDLVSARAGLSRIQAGYESSVSRSRLTAEEARARLSKIETTGEMEALSSCDLVIEAVYEDMSLKQSLFTRLDKILKGGAILATNTSGLDIDKIAESTSRPHDVIGAHFFSPAHVQKLLEIVRGRDTASDCVRTLICIAERLKKVAVVSANHPGFIGNALFRHYIREAHFLVEDGALPHEVDAALTEFGFAMGVFAVHDLAGNDVGWSMRKAEIATRPANRRWNDLILELCDMGRFGQKVGKGWYAYRDGDRTPERDPQLEEFIIERSKRLGIVRRRIDKQEVVERCLYSMINEAARLLDAGVASRPSDVDLVFVTGYGFPKSKGGPLYFADQIGLAHVYERVIGYFKAEGVWWQPAPLLARLALSGGSFGEMGQGADVRI